MLGIEPLLEKWGAKLGENIVVDFENVHPLEGPTTWAADKYADHPAVKKLDGKLTFWPAILLWSLFAAAIVVCTRQGWLKLFGPVLVYDMIRTSRRNRAIRIGVQNHCGNKPLHKVRVGEPERSVALTRGRNHRVDLVGFEPQFGQRRHQDEPALLLARTIKRQDLRRTAFDRRIERFTTVGAHDHGCRQPPVGQTIYAPDERVDAAYVFVMHIGRRS